MYLGNGCQLVNDAAGCHVYLGKRVSFTSSNNGARSDLHVDVLDVTGEVLKAASELAQLKQLTHRMTNLFLATVLLRRLGDGTVPSATSLTKSWVLLTLTHHLQRRTGTTRDRAGA